MEKEIFLLELAQDCTEFPQANFGATFEQHLLESDCMT